MQGSKKIYKLDADLWSGARKGLRRVHTGWWPIDPEDDIDYYV